MSTRSGMMERFNDRMLSCSNCKTESGKREVAKRLICGTLAKSIHTMSNPKIIAYLKPTCGWSNGVRAILNKYELPYEDRNVLGDPALRQEMIEKSGQTLSPCVEVDGVMLTDVSGEEVESYLLDKKVVAPTDRPLQEVTHQCCGE